MDFQFDTKGQNHSPTLHPSEYNDPSAPSSGSKLINFGKNVGGKIFEKINNKVTGGASSSNMITNNEAENILFTYEADVPFEKRCKESARIVERYPTRIPVVCERVPNFIQKNNLPELSKKKFLVPNTMTLSQFYCVLKQQIKEERPSAANKSLYFLLRNRRAPRMGRELKEIYAESKWEDGFLYLHFCEESLFG